jgi:ABC-type glycerol-3-phosphate transport system substrate-binding protein
MQQPFHPIPQNRSRRSTLTAPSFWIGAALIFALGGALSGCDGSAPPSERSTPGAKPHAGARLTVSCPDPALATALDPIVRTWSVRTGATVALVPTPLLATDAADIGVIAPGELGKLAEDGVLTPVPARVRTGEQFQWSGLLPAYSERLVAWGGQTLAVPLIGDGYVLVYRVDRLADASVIAEFRKRHQRDPSAPATWEELADLAKLFADLDGKPSLPPLPADPDRLFDLFCRVAASADRRALNDLELAVRTASDRDALAFEFSVVTGAPRLQTDGFQFAARWLDRLRAAKALPAPDGSDDPIARLADGRAVLALVALDQLARLPREGGAVPARFGLASVPGTREYRDPARAQGGPAQLNYVPYFSGGRLGVVRAKCPNQDAAFDLLAELGGPARSAELLSAPGLGAGPTRTAHLERDRLVLWLGYGFDDERSKFLQDALRQYASQAIKYPAFGLRTPDRAALVPAAADPLRKIASGAATPNDALKQLDGAWNALDANVPPATLLRWRQRAAGLN